MTRFAVWISLPALAFSACEGRTDGRPQTHQKTGVPLDLPQPNLRGNRALEDVLAARRSVRRFAPRDLTLEECSQLLWAAQGISEERRGLRTAPSAGATYPLETYAVTAAGVYRYRTDGHRLDPLSAGDRRAALADAALGQACVRDAPLIVAFSAIEARTMRRYGDRGRMYIHMEAGHAAQNVHLQAVALGLGSVPVGAFDPERAARVLGLPEGEILLYLIPVGEPAE